MKTKLLKEVSEIKKEKTAFQLELEKQVTRYYAPDVGEYKRSTAEIQNYYAEMKNSTPKLALETISNGLFTATTPPNNQFFQLEYPTKDEKFDGDKDYLNSLEQVISEYLMESKFYQLMPNVYRDLALIGYSIMGLSWSEKNKGFLFKVYEPNTYYFSVDDDQDLDRFYYENKITRKQFLEKYGELPKSCTNKATLTLCKLIKRNPDYELQKTLIDGIEQNKNNIAFEWVQYTYLKEQDTNDFYKTEYFHNMPVFLARWNYKTNSPYPASSPCISCLADVKQLQEMERQELKGIEKTVTPPIQAPPSSEARDLSSASINIVENGTISPIITVPTGSLHHMTNKRIELEQKILRALHSDLFNSILYMDKTGATATEVNAKLIQSTNLVAPILHKINHDFFDKLFARIYNLLMYNEVINENEERGSIEFNIVYKSVTSDVKKLKQRDDINTAILMTQQLGSLNPEVAQAVDPTVLLKEVKDMLDIKGNWVKSDDVINKEKEAMLEQQEMQQAMQLAQQVKELEQE